MVSGHVQRRDSGAEVTRVEVYGKDGEGTPDGKS